MFIDDAKNMLKQDVYLLEGQERIGVSGPRVFITGGAHWAMRLESGEQLADSVGGFRTPSDGDVELRACWYEDLGYGGDILFAA